MVSSTKRIALALSGCLVLGMTACASVPKEAVALSVAVGQDITQLHTGYRESVRFAFNQMRQAGLGVIDNVWTPAYLKDFVTTGMLVESAETGTTELVEFWARTAIEAIDNKRKEFLDPLQLREDALLVEIDAAFDRVISANAAVTAHLNSVLKVQTVQDQVLEATGLLEIRDTINGAIVSASDFAAGATRDIEAAAALLETQ